MFSYHSNELLKHSILMQLEDQLINTELQPLIIENDNLEIYSVNEQSIDYEKCSGKMGIPESLLRLMMLPVDSSAYLDEKELIRDSVKERMKLFTAIPVGKDLTYVAPCYLDWLLHETTFGAARFATELGDLLAASTECLAANVMDKNVLAKINHFEEESQTKYLSLYDEDIHAACRWSRVAQIAEFLRNIQYFLSDNSCISQDEISHLLCMGLGLKDDQDYFDVIEQMELKLFTLLK